jgi:hypothetical protein
LFLVYNAGIYQQVLEITHRVIRKDLSKSRINATNCKKMMQSRRKNAIIMTSETEILSLWGENAGKN